MSEKIIITFLLIAGIAAIAFGMLSGNNYVFIVGIVMVIAGYCLIRKNLKKSISRQQGLDTSDTSRPTDEEQDR